MEGSEHSLVPQWLKSRGSVSRETSINSQLTSSPYSDHINYAGCKQSFGSKGSRFSRSYSSSGRIWHDRDWEKDIDNFVHKDKLSLGERNRGHFDYVDNIFSNRFEKGLLQRSKSMTSGRWGESRETWSTRTAGDVSNPLRNHGKTDGMVTGVVGIMNKTVFEEEFPLLGAEDKHGGSELGRVSSSSSSTSSQSPLTGASEVIVSNGLTSASSSSVTSGTMGLSMAKTLVQGPPRTHTLPQVSVGTQKLEELALKQSRLLIPMTPSMPRSMVVSPAEKSKVKPGQQQYPFSYSRPLSHSPRVAPANADLPKIAYGNSHSVSALQELHGVSSAVKDSISPSRSKVVLSPIGATTSTSISAPCKNSSNNAGHAGWITLEKKPTFHSQSRSDFFKNLSRKSSLKKPCSDACPTGTFCVSNKPQVVTRNVTGHLIMQSRDASSVETTVGNSLTESSCIITENGNAASEPLKFSTNIAHHLSANPVLYSDEEEIAFLHSLGWEESAGEDEGLTEEEIRDFYEKYMKLQPSSNILQKCIKT